MGLAVFFRRYWRYVLVILLAAALLTWGWVDVVRARAVPATGREGQKTDLTVYLAAASALKAGQDIYEARNVRGWPYLYPPLAALPFVPLTNLSIGAAAYTWFLVSLGCLAASAAAIWVTLRQIDARWAKQACLMGLLPVAIPMLHTLQRGQINALPLLFVCLAIYALARHRDLLAGVSLAMAAAIKVTPGLAAVYFLWRWVRHQLAARRSGTWHPATLLECTRSPIGFVLGLALGLIVLPGLYMGPQEAVSAVAAWRAKVASGYVASDDSGRIFRQTTAIHEISDRNQSWYRVAASSAWLYDDDALASRDQLQPAWQQRVRWMLLAAGIVWATIFAWASRSDGTPGEAPAACAGLAAFVWLGISFGKIAWSHFYVMIYPLAAIAWLIARRHADSRNGRALSWMFRLMIVACLLHYGLTGSDDAGEPTATRAQRAAKRTKVHPPRDLGELLVPAGLLALATVVVANRRPEAIDCRQLQQTAAVASA